MPTLSGNLLGIALGERSLLVAEVSATSRGAQRRIDARRMAEFVYPAGTSLEAPAALGEALKEFLAAQKFSTRAAVIGLPAKWLMVRPRQLPAVAENMIADALRLQAESEFTGEMEYVYDYDAGPADSGSAGTGSARSVLLMATPASRVEAVTQLAEAAGVKIRRITASATALARATDPQLARGIVLWIGSQSGELTVHSAGQPAMLRHLRIDSGAAGNGAGIDALVGEVRRALAAGQTNGSTGVSLWDGLGLNAQQLARLQTAVGVPVRNERLSALGINPATPEQEPRFATAIALALSGLSAAAGVDFLHSRLAPPAPPRLRRSYVYGGAVALIVLLAVLWAWLDVHQMKSKLQAVHDQETTIAADVKAATDLKQRFDHARVYMQQQPHVVRCMADLVNLFPFGRGTEQTWATGLDMKCDPDSDAIKCTLTVKTSEDEQQKLPDNLRKSGRFPDVTDSTNVVGRSNEEYAMRLSFTYTPTTAPAAPVAKK